jgi:hypothetical protein
MLNLLPRTNKFTGSSTIEKKGFTETPKPVLNNVTFQTNTGFVGEAVSQESQLRAFYNTTIQKTLIQGKRFV